MSRAGPPIAAIATPPGVGAVAMLRLSGAGSTALVDRLFDGRQALADAPPRRLCHGRIRDEAGHMLDEVLAVRFEAPASYTGEEAVEIGCHGGSLVTASILGLLLRSGARMAEPGEFTQRAFLAGKLDLTQAEAVLDLISARTPLALRAAAGQLDGRIGRQTEQVRADLLDTLAHLEAWIDFPEEGIAPDTGAALLERIDAALRTTDLLLSTADEGRLLREGVRLAICGPPNAGKSSMLNQLLGFERAIVSEVPGTTRDTVEETANVRGIPFRIVDTAGLRQTADPVEREGVERARQAIAVADIVLEVADATSGQRAELDCDGKPHLLAWNKTDLPAAGPLPAGSDGLAVSCRTGDGIAALVARLADLAGHRLPEGNMSPAAINARHQACLTRAREALEAARTAIADGLEPELAAVDLRAALEAVGEIAGHADAEEILGQIFSNFCIGK